VQQAQASVQNIDAQIAVQHAQISATEAQLDGAKAALVFAQQQAWRYQKLAKDGWGTVQNEQQYTSQLHQQEATVQTALENLNQVQRQTESLKAQRLSAEATLAQNRARLRQAQVDLERTRILSPVDGYVTNLLAQLGDYINVGVNAISLVDADSYWVDGYFEETTLAPIRVGNSAQIKLMGQAGLRAPLALQFRGRQPRFRKSAHPALQIAMLEPDRRAPRCVAGRRQSATSQS
jgi:multidrug resistance efflux pump